MKPSTVLIFVTGILAMPTEKKQDDDIAITNKYLFNMSLSDFSAKLEAKDPPSLDWSTDGCTSASDHPLGYNFRTACERHDFGYNNLVKQGLLNEDSRMQVDSQFRIDLLTECDINLICRLVAEIYYGAVSIFGSAYVKHGKRDEAIGLNHYDLIAVLAPTLNEIADQIEQAGSAVEASPSAAKADSSDPEESHHLEHE